MEKTHKSKALQFCCILVLFILLIILAVHFLPYMSWMGKQENLLLLRDWIHSKGLYGIFIFLALQVGQILIAFIPGEPIEFVAGMIYGTWGGLALCLIGIFIGSTCIWTAVKRLGKPFVHRFLPEDKINTLSLFQNTERLNSIVFLLFLIPGTPKDTLLYLCPLTPVKASHFFVISTLARIPSVITSTWAGATMSKGNIWTSVTILIITSILGLAGIASQQRVSAFLQKNIKKYRKNTTQPKNTKQ